MLNLTFTGVDRFTNIRSLPGGIELGILYSENPTYRNRYPDIFTIGALLYEIRSQADPELSISLHVCGLVAKKNILQERIVKGLDGLIDRIQINGHLHMLELINIIDMYKIPVITQVNDNFNQDLVCSNIKKHHILVDASGGKGLSPTSWKKPNTTNYTGYAGGLGPHNIVEELGKIIEVAGNPEENDFWIDMESHIRNRKDRFDVNRVYKVIEEIYEHFGC